MFVTFEGPEGAGKSTAIGKVAAELRQLGRRVRLTREPGSGELGPQIRKILLDSASLGNAEELFLFLTDRANHVSTVVRPALDQGDIVLCDRFSDSTVVYQGYGRGIDLEFLRQANALATGGLRPDLTLLFDIDPENGLSRLQSLDRLDREPIEFHRRIREGFLSEASREPERWRIVDASELPEEVAQNSKNLILEALEPRLSREGY